MSERFCIVLIPRFELSFRSFIVNKVVIICCKYSFLNYTLSEILTIKWVVWFGSSVTFAVAAVICLAQHLRIIILDDVPKVGGTAITHAQSV